jgi:cob(I)alamin adenosyltransferase
VVTLNKIYTRTGDGGDTGLATGERVLKHDARVSAYGTVDEVNAAIGVARLACGDDPELDAILGRIQNDLFDLGADLATPESDKPLGWEPLRIVPAQVARLEQEIDALNHSIPPLDSFILPGGSALAAHLHVARTFARRAERDVSFLMAQPNTIVSKPAFEFLNRLSDLLFVVARRANCNGATDVKWVPGLTRPKD